MHFDPPLQFVALERPRPNRKLENDFADEVGRQRQELTPRRLAENLDAISIRWEVRLVPSFDSRDQFVQRNRRDCVPRTRRQELQNGLPIGLSDLSALNEGGDVHVEDELWSSEGHSRKPTDGGSGENLIVWCVTNSEQRRPFEAKKKRTLL